MSSKDYLRNFQISPPLFRNIQVINWHKYKESTNKNAIYVCEQINYFQPVRLLWYEKGKRFIWETFRSPHRLFRNIQVINWHKYKESTNKNAKYVNSLFVCWGVIFQNSKVTRSIIWLLSQAHAFEHDSFLRNGMVMSNMCNRKSQSMKYSWKGKRFI